MSTNGRQLHSAGRRSAGVALVTVSAAAFGAMPIMAKLAYDAGAEPGSVLVTRFVVAGATMTAVMLLRGHQWPRGRVLLALIGMGGVGYVSQSLSYFTALTVASASLVALLLYLYPAIVTVLAAVVLRERLTAVTVIALLLTLGGSVLVIGPGGGRPLGVALGVSAAVIYSIYILVGSRVTPRAGAIPSSTVIILAAAGVYVALAAVRRPEFPHGPGATDGWLAMIGIALVSTVVAIVTFFAGLARLGPADASTLSTLEPVVSVALAAVVLRESIGWLQLAGGALIIPAVILLARRKPAVARRDEPAPAG
jgi:drug/metabolite transporter (DMT)-like permease